MHVGYLSVTKYASSAYVLYIIYSVVSLVPPGSLILLAWVTLLIGPTDVKNFKEIKCWVFLYRLGMNAWNDRFMAWNADHEMEWFYI